MLIELAFRFIVGGMVVCAFAALGGVLRPKTFAGIFGGAPSVAVATVGLTLAMKGATYTGLEGRSMMAGAAGFLVYCVLCNRMLLTRELNSIAAASVAFSAWFLVAIGLWAVLLR